MGLEIKYNKKVMLAPQHENTQSVVDRFTDCNSTKAPIESQPKPIEEAEQKDPAVIKEALYMCGSLVHLSTRGHPSVVLAVGRASNAQTKGAQSVMTTRKVVRDNKGTVNLALLLPHEGYKEKGAPRLGWHCRYLV